MKPIRHIALCVLSFLLVSSAFAGFASRDLFLPAVGRVPGAESSDFYTTLWVTNPNAVAVSAELYFLRGGQSNLAPSIRTVMLEAGETKRFENVVETLFMTTGLGALRVRATAEVLATARIYNKGAGLPLRSSQGLSFSAVPSTYAIGSGQSAAIQGVAQDEDFRTNFFLVETAGLVATARVALKDANGRVLGSKDYVIQPYEQRLMPVTDLVAGTIENGQLSAEVVAGGGKIIIASSQTANGSNDGTSFEMSFIAPAATAPGVTSFNGVSGDIQLQAGPNITITRANNTFTIMATGGGSGAFTLPYRGTYGSTAGAFAVENTNGPALMGTTTGDPEVAYAVWGQNSRTRAVGYLGSWFYGVGGVAEGNRSAAIYGAGYQGANAAIFNGRVTVTGTLEKSAGSFKIDHPLDPTNKYLYHSFVESPEMKNVYDGTIVLDAKGEGIVSLPEWFEALNRDFRYQLTPIGAHAPLFIAEEIANNAFRIAGGTSGMKVSWQVTGVRKDPYAVANPIEVEKEKEPHEKGTYLHPEAYRE